MTEKVFEEVFKAYTRFLKDNGVYKRAMELHSTHNKDCNDTLPIIKKKLCELSSPIYFISNVFMFCAWAGTSEGEDFWWKISVKWEIKCALENIGGEVINNLRLVMLDIMGILREIPDKLTKEERNYFKDSLQKIKALT